MVPPTPCTPKVSFPYHFHLANEEALYVLHGRGLLRLGGRTIPVAAGHYVAFPVGRAGAHQMINDSAEPLRYLCFSTMVEPDVAVYPDSAKLSIFGGTPPGGEENDLHYYAVLKETGTIDYWDGEGHDARKPPAR
jgi:uncharacterized cupin superfamily protein